MRMNKKGFTLVELMIVLAILGLLAGIGIPQYIKVLGRAQVAADNARLAQVQSFVNAFIAEVGGIEGVHGLPDAGKEVLEPGEISGKSLLTGDTITLEAADVTLDLLKELEEAMEHEDTLVRSFTLTQMGKFPLMRAREALAATKEAAKFNAASWRRSRLLLQRLHLPHSPGRVHRLSAVPLSGLRAPAHRA
jgi:prepilin-type N-terminal cleavage/methylation domain-containing protein